MKNILVLTTLAAMALLPLGQAQTISDLHAQYRDGQVFLTWQEKDLPDEVKLTVLSHHQPITADNFAAATVLSNQIHRGSARDWWQDPQSFDRSAEAAPAQGFVIVAAGAPLAPDSGLHVHTVTVATAGPRYYAVFWAEAPQFALGVNSLASPCVGQVSQPCPIWQSAPAEAPARQSASGKALVISLHGRGGGITAGPRAQPANYLWFADRSQGWRESLPFKFNLRVGADNITLVLHDRVWANRPVLESPDARDHCPAISTWWFGYNRNLPETTDTPEIVGDNYTQRYILGLIKWACDWLGADRNQVYLTGGSMGGSGSVALALNYPQVFAAVHALVPVYSYTWETCSTSKSATAARLACPMGPLRKRAGKLPNGADLLQHLDGARNIAVSVDTPPIFATNGRGDASIPWNNNPAFYRAANDAGQALAVYWNDGNHGMSSTAPADVKNWASKYRKYRLNQCFPAFANCSDNRDYGQGKPEDGDQEGWLNRGLDWQNPVDLPKKLGMTITAEYPEIKYPLQVDVVLRRIQNFKCQPGDQLQLQIGTQAPVTYVVPENGLLIVSQLTVNDPEGTTFAFTK